MKPARKLKDIVRRLTARDERVPPALHANTFVQPGNQWYQPMLGGALTLAPFITGEAVVREALQVLERLTTDAYADFVREFYRSGLQKFASGWQYADINTALLALSRVLAPADYLEIGVRRGRSLAMVASRAPECRIVACDLFLDNYANMENPGPDFVRSELARVGFGGSIQFVIGDSAAVLPPYFEQHPDLFFDLITVDGDHTERGARIDLQNVLPRLKIGGALVFDDLSNSAHPELERVWEVTVVADRRFSTFSFTDVGFGVGIAVRRE
ncbi:MAG TPA: class I SAM-dependent methyltransferase [Vicinamibacterales bacterium]